MASTQSWQEVAADAKARQQASIDALGYKVPDVPDSVLNVAAISLEDYLSPLAIEITERNGGVGDLLQKLASGAYSSEDVVVSSPQP